MKQPDPEPLRTAAYARISLDRRDGAGVGRQLTDSRAWAAETGLDGVREFIDNSRSAYNPKSVRPEFEALMGLVRAGDIQQIAVWKLDRLYRRVTELSDTLLKAAEQGRGVVVVETRNGTRWDLRDRYERARLAGMVARAEEASAETAARVARAREEKARDGEYGGGRRPFGYSPDGMHIVDSEAAEIRSAADRVLAGVSLREIARDLRVREVPTVTGAAWTPATLRDVLLKPRLAGFSVYRGEEVGRGRWPAILEEATWRGLKSRLDAPERRTSPGPAPRWLGSGLYLCGSCGAALRVQTAGSRRPQPAYRCQRYSEPAPKGGGHVVRAARPLDAYVEQLLIARLARPDLAELMAPPVEHGVDLGLLHAERQTLQQRLEDLGADLAEGISIRTIRSASRRLEARIGQIDEQIERTAATSPLAAFAGQPDVSAVWESLDLGRRRIALGALMTVTALPAGRGAGFDPARIRIEWRTGG